MNWNCKTIPTSKATSEIKNLRDAEKTEYLYSQMVNIGTQSLEKATAAQMGKLAEEVIPCGDELASAVNNTTLPLEEWMSFVYDTPDIQLEREMQWPVDRDLIYWRDETKGCDFNLFIRVMFLILIFFDLRIFIN